MCNIQEHMIASNLDEYPFKSLADMRLHPVRFDTSDKGLRPAS